MLQHDIPPLLFELAWNEVDQLLHVLHAINLTWLHKKRIRCSGRCRIADIALLQFQAPTSELHVTETQFNEPCYGVLRTMPLPTGKARARIHVHSFRGSSDTWTICVGASTSAADSFIGNMNAALSSRGVADVVVEKKGVGACSDSPGKEGRDELGLEIKRGLALNMAADASTYKCGKDTPTASAFAAFVDALQWTFPGCTASNQASTGTNSLPSCTVGCKPSGTRNC
jgi:hypothetical protein